MTEFVVLAAFAVLCVWWFRRIGKPALNTLDALRREMDAAAGHDTPLAAAYRAGWIACSKWANRDDLAADTDSPAYVRERDSDLAALK